MKYKMVWKSDNKEFSDDDTWWSVLVKHTNTEKNYYCNKN